MVVGHMAAAGGEAGRWWVVIQGSGRGEHPPDLVTAAAQSFSDDTLTETLAMPTTGTFRTGFSGPGQDQNRHQQQGQDGGDQGEEGCHGMNGMGMRAAWVPPDGTIMPTARPAMPHPVVNLNHPRLA